MKATPRLFVGDVKDFAIHLHVRIKKPPRCDVMLDNQAEFKFY